MSLQIVGRSSSHFTRVARVVAAALDVPLELAVVPDLTSTDPSDYGGNPGLKIPALRDAEAVIFGAENVARAIASRAPGGRIVWPEEITSLVTRNAHEITWTAMSTQVQIAISAAVVRASGPDAIVSTAIAGTAVELATHFHRLPLEHPLATRLDASLRGALAWLDAQADEALAGLPADRTLSLFEIALVCLVEHVAFRRTADLAPHGRLRAVVDALGAREPFVRTRFRFDPT